MRLFFFLSLLALSSGAFAQKGKHAKAASSGNTVSSAPTAVAVPKGGNVLDFEGEVIEGERKRPDLFLQISTKDLSFDSLLYLRNNFNDYLEIDRKSRNRYFKVKGR